MPDDVGGQPFPDGEEPDFDHGAADEEFATVVFDEDFVRSAPVHELSAAERILAAAQSHAETEPPRAYEDGYGYAPGREGEYDPDDEDRDLDDDGRFDRSDYAEYAEIADSDDFVQYGPYNSYGQYGGGYVPGFEAVEEHGSDVGYPRAGYPPRVPAPLRPYRGHFRWQRPVAWVLAVVMGIGVVALALSAVYRGTSGQRQEPAPPPATSGVGSGGDRENALGEPSPRVPPADPEADPDSVPA